MNFFASVSGAWSRVHRILTGGVTHPAAPPPRRAPGVLPVPSLWWRRWLPGAACTRGQRAPGGRWVHRQPSSCASAPHAARGLALAVHSYPTSSLSVRKHGHVGSSPAFPSVCGRCCLRFSCVNAVGVAVPFTCSLSTSFQVH